jgi:hypothetical protein
VTTTIPQVSDPWKRVARSVVQVVLAFLSFAAVFPAIVAAVGVPHGSNVAVWLATAATWVTIVSGALTRIMAIPAVNTLLTQIGLGGHSGNVVANDSWTTKLTIPVQPATPLAAPDASQITPGPQPGTAAD